MHLYLSFLLKDIRKAHRTDEGDTDEVLTFEEEMEIVEGYATGKNLISLGAQCGLTKEQFPPPRMLTDDEMKIIIDAFHEMLDTWHISVDLPGDLPVIRAYTLLIGLLDNEACYFP